MKDVFLRIPISFFSDSLPITSHKTTLVPVSNNGGNNSNIFAKIGRLNEALQAINPRYQPIGFSITSMDSCSPGVLQDALVAAETGVFTLLSVIGKVFQEFQKSKNYLKKIFYSSRTRDAIMGSYQTYIG